MRKLISICMCFLLIVPTFTGVTLASENDITVETLALEEPQDLLTWFALTVIAWGVHKILDMGYWRLIEVEVTLRRNYATYIEALDAVWELTMEAKQELSARYPLVVHCGESSAITEECRLRPYVKGSFVLE